MFYPNVLSLHNYVEMEWYPRNAYIGANALHTGG